MGNHTGKFYGYTGLFPVRDSPEEPISHLDALRALLNNMESGPGCLFARTRLVHGARLFLIDDVIYNGHPTREEHLAYPYLALSLTFDGDLKGLAAAIAMQVGPDFERIFQHCYGFKNASMPSPVLSYLEQCQVTTTFLYVDADASLKLTLKALKVQALAREMVVRTQGQDIATRRAALTELREAITAIEEGQPGTFTTEEA